MTRKIQQLSIDGVSIDSSKVRFADTFEVSDTDEGRLAFDEEVIYVVVARVSTPSFRESRAGAVSRVNVLKIKEARLLTGEHLQGRVLDAAGFDYRPQPSLFEESPEEEVTVADLEEQGVRVKPEPDPDQGNMHFDDSEVDLELKEFLAITRKIHDEEDALVEEGEALPASQAARIVADARGRRATDPILDKFLQ